MSAVRRPAGEPMLRSTWWLPQGELRAESARAAGSLSQAVAREIGRAVTFARPLPLAPLQRDRERHRQDRNPDKNAVDDAHSGQR